MNKTGILFQHQLFEYNPLLPKCDKIYLVEEVLFFKQYKFHKQKIAFHRASMKFYENYLQSNNIKVVYIDSFNALADVRLLIQNFFTAGITDFEYIDTTDCWLEQRLKKACEVAGVKSKKNRSPLFLCSPEEIETYFSDKKKAYVSNRFL